MNKFKTKIVMALVIGGILIAFISGNVMGAAAICKGQKEIQKCIPWVGCKTFSYEGIKCDWYRDQLYADKNGFQLKPCPKVCTSTGPNCLYSETSSSSTTCFVGVTKWKLGVCSSEIVGKC